MTSQLLWLLIAGQIVMAAFDTIYHHELTEGLAWRPTQRRELALHAARSLLYAPLFLALGLTEPHGTFAMLAIAALAIELAITLADFVEEDLTRKLPASERVLHTLLALNYGGILALLLPVLIGWAAGAQRHLRARPGGGPAPSDLAAVSGRDLAWPGRRFRRRAAPGRAARAARKGASERF
jgi:hypothetical protein